MALTVPGVKLGSHLALVALCVMLTLVTGGFWPIVGWAGLVLMGLFDLFG